MLKLTWALSTVHSEIVMSKRFNLPYTTQDLFPQVGASHGSTFSRQDSVTGSSYISNGSSLVNTPTMPSISTRRFPNLKKMFKRLFKPNTLDFETAVWEIFYLILNPKKMYRSHYYYKQQQSGKTSYTRDDPSFLILLTLFLSISAIAWGIAYSPHIWDIIKLIIYMVLVDFYLTGMVIATLSWILMNRLFNKPNSGSSIFNTHSMNYVEWSFCFDIHCNSFLIIWCLLYVLQFLLLPLLMSSKSFISCLFGNSLYFGSIGYYFIVSFYGFNSLPFINHTTTAIGKNTSNSPSKILQMIIIIIVLPTLIIGWFTSVLLGFNVANSMVDTYFN